MEESKLQALHDSLSQIRGRKGLGTNGSQYSWQRTTVVNSKNNDLPSNALYAHFVPEGSYDPQAKGDGRIVKRDFSESSKEERKRRRKEEKKAAKLQAKREAKLEEKRRLKAMTTPNNTGKVAVSDDSCAIIKSEASPKQKKKSKVKTSNDGQQLVVKSQVQTSGEKRKKEKKSKKRKKDADAAVDKTNASSDKKQKKEKKKPKKEEGNF